MFKGKFILGAGLYLLLVVFIFMFMQALIILLHEFMHSTVGWLIGAGNSPSGIVWGNPVTMTGWDEGVDYERLFVLGKGMTAAITGVSPLVMHALFVGCGLAFLSGDRLRGHNELYPLLYWFMTAHLMELVAYLYMRPFSGHGDTGLFARGTGLSHWWLFIVGTALLSWALWAFYSRILPRMQEIVFPDNRLGQWVLLALTSFIIFLWGSGIRVMLYVEGPQWLFGLVGILLMFFTLFRFRPGAGCN
ncbi:hypothetical protein [Maridesulfovibrio sp. FT414]|uniref:hypothetical protein n=1 Tax=Maridesulfovibrio sp. FT414 TaxID=2979469 RepID=UPI003D808612